MNIDISELDKTNIIQSNEYIQGKISDLVYEEPKGSFLIFKIRKDDKNVKK
ncbi:hypothetical protein [Clostridium cadaveris]|uniref:Uncharacterized protein n=1 Tax=Clostridium cadaveris TaxID=1529 RepID=A0A1I2KN24_9CLOT|nr:hypothetical protein [Clostridium cadaveris]NME65843.1 hypothetical protein [Clostridium cadaveris]SFF68402.1 hypothetical protein SAMN04487885_106136 [Clostridium cadaveris]